MDGKVDSAEIDIHSGIHLPGHGFVGPGTKRENELMGKSSR